MGHGIGRALHTPKGQLVSFAVLDVGQREGRAIVALLGVKTVPATVIDGVLKHVGVPTTREAMEFVAAAPDKAAGMARYVGMTLAPSSSSIKS